MPTPKFLCVFLKAECLEQKLPAAGARVEISGHLLGGVKLRSSDLMQLGLGFDLIVKGIEPVQSADAVEERKGDRAVLKLATDLAHVSLLGQFAN